MRPPDPTEFGIALADVIPELLVETELGLDCCILATRVGLLVAREYGLVAAALPVRVAAMNDTYRQMMNEWSGNEEWLNRDRLPPDEHEKWFERGAWCVMLGFGQDPDAARPGYDGHVVLTLGRRVLVDLTIGQATRPGKEIVLEQAVLDDADFVRGRSTHAAWSADSGATVVYWRHENRGFLGAADWARPRLTDPFTRAVRHRVKGVLDA